MKFQFDKLNINELACGDIIVTSNPSKIFMVIEDTSGDYSLLNMETFSIDDNISDCYFIENLIKDVQREYTISRIIKNTDLVLKEENTYF